MILTVTPNPAVDQTLTFEGALAADEVNRAREAQFDTGGKGINVSEFLDALGTETVASGLVGGFTGEYLTESLAEAGIDTDFVAVDHPTRLNTTALAADGEYKLNVAGHPVDGAVVDDLVSRVRAHAPEWVLVGGSLPPGMDAASIDRLARAGDSRAVVDVEGALLAEVDAAVALCKPNRSELADATGMAVDTVEESAAAARALREQGYERVVASLGADGALLAGPSGVIHAAALDVEVVDTVGSGDALLAGVLSALHGGAGDEAALRRGVALASRVVAQAGTAVPALEDLDSDGERVAVQRR